MAEFYDVDSFLSADNQKVPCKFHYDIPNLGYLANTSDRDLLMGTVVELPLWLALDLAQVPNRDFLTIAMPKPFAPRVRNALAASAKAVNLRSLSGGSFFASGVKLNDSIDDTTVKLRETLHKTFVDRLEEVFDQAQHASSAPSSHDIKLTSSSAHQQPIDEKAADFVAGMDDWEKQLFQVAESAAKASLSWSSR